MPRPKKEAEFKNKGGRPKSSLDYETIEKLASMMCTQEEIASYFDVSVRTLQRDEEFCRVYKKGLDKGKMSLRRKQYQMSDTNVTMAIWLGKQYLGQTDKVDSKIETKQTFSEMNNKYENL
jgi:hypothetical protein